MNFIEDSSLAVKFEENFTDVNLQERMRRGLKKISIQYNDKKTED